MASKGSEVVDVQYDRIKLDDKKYKSILFEFGDKEVWLPRSLIEVDTDARVVVMPRWKAEQAEIEDFVE